MNTYKKIVAFGCMYLIYGSLKPFDNPHFYRATNLFQEPRIERAWLTSLDITLAGGSTRCARNKNGDTVPLLDLYGPHNMHELGVNVPCKDLTNPLDLILTQLALTPSRDCFANFSIGGKFRLIETNFLFSQNFTKGFFVQLHFPIRQFNIKDICFQDLSPTNDVCPNINTPIWQTFLNNFDAILQRYNLCSEPFCESGIGDTTVILGWTHNYQDTEVLDFVDTTFRIGVLIPTGKERNENQIFSLPFGYNGHVGVPILFDFAFGAYEWLTIGFHIDGLVFANKTRVMRVKTALNQSGFIKLAQEQVRVDKGSIWSAGAFIKADHFLRGLSALFGYSFVNESNDKLTPCNCNSCISCSALNSDEMLKGFKMHTVHFVFEYDMTNDNASWGPKIGLFYNHIVSGKRIFKTNMLGGLVGVDVAWNF